MLRNQRTAAPGAPLDETMSPGDASGYESRYPSLTSAIPTPFHDTNRATAVGRIEFWYSRKQALLLVMALFALARIFGSLIPPFQSPDEFNHLKRAYLLSRGVILIGSRGEHSGAGVDEGLLAYMECYEKFPTDYGVKVDRATVRACESIHYTSKKKFSDLSNTAMYFPLLYVPQAMAIFIGEKTDLSVNDSYYLARLFSSSATLALLMWALMIYPVPPAALALFLLPMCLFQVSSASLDAMSFATTVLTAALFLRGYHRQLAFSPRLHTTLAMCIFSLATSRIIYVVLSPLLMVLYRVRRSRTYVFSFVAVLCASLTWITFALTTVHGRGAITQEASSLDIGRYYVSHPGTFLVVVFRTFTDAPTLRGWWQMFVGVLGWMDTPIGSAGYFVLTIELLTIVFISNSVPSLRSLNKGHLVLACTGAAAMLLLLLVALSAWTVHPATVIECIEGRYFYPIVLLFLFAFWTAKPSRVRINLSFAILIVMAVSSVEFAVPRLVDRYYAH